ncbi:hypothetical protein SFC79_11345 [Nocardioides sp. S-58]|uniref:Uncharacterized protein n=1 Tax=Nocardioides renjunii TaxID=3095075 RepID=A0ABU5KCR9_9ACTN|nr:hypothetical protein [Nocardioides sp. S-58]MDZ5662360.1 hypothetical protein [Nocardioides sp. S-58]
MGTTFLIAVIIGVLGGAASSLVTRRLGVAPGVGLAVVFTIGALALLAVVDLGLVITAMLAFAVTAAIFDPRPEKRLATS